MHFITTDKLELIVAIPYTAFSILKLSRFDALRTRLERMPEAHQYYGGAFPVYNLDYGTPYAMRFDKFEIYSVEAVKADLRHYLNCRACKSRCFPRQIHSLMNNLQLLVDCFNQKQLTQRQYPQYAYHLIAFLPIPV